MRSGSAFRVIRSGQTADDPRQIAFGRDMGSGLYLPQDGNRRARRAHAAKLRKINIGLKQGLVTEHQGHPWPRCMICQRGVEEIELVEEMPRGARVLARCHGAEELKSFELEEDWDKVTGLLEQRMARFNWFDPAEMVANP